jgi:hypothetical protein
MNVQKFAGDNPIIQQMAADLERQRQRDKAYLAEIKRAGDEQTRRDVAAAYGIIIPFS